MGSTGPSAKARRIATPLAARARCRCGAVPVVEGVGFPRGARAEPKKPAKYRKKMKCKAHRPCSGRETGHTSESKRVAVAVLQWSRRVERAHFAMAGALTGSEG